MDERSVTSWKINQKNQWAYKLTQGWIICWSQNEQMMICGIRTISRHCNEN